MRAIVIGGGVAGTVSAVALRRIGAEVTLVEAYPDPEGEVGSFLSLAANGLRALAAIDCLAPVRRRGFPVPRQRMWSGSGKLLGDVARGRRADDGMHSVTLMRGHLVGELRAVAADAGVQVITGETYQRSTTVDGRVTACLNSGRTIDGDVMVGADGIWSTVRRELDPGAATPRYSGVYVVSGRSAGVEVDCAPFNDPGVFNMVLARHATFIYLHGPDAEVWWQAQVNDPVPPPLNRDETGWRAELGRLFTAEQVPAAVVAATTTLHRPTRNQLLGPVPIWHDRHRVLVGDAAHPVGAGQGASMAVEDGLALAAALAQAPSVAAGLAGYERYRRPRITRMEKAADDNREVKKSGRVRRRVEEVIMPIVFRHVYERATGWLYDYEPPRLVGAGR
jgi:2-polyprenyl-6-methoxyphenol hydroxylase-like FAD-dependent oxidoreductase